MGTWLNSVWEFGGKYSASWRFGFLLIAQGLHVGDGVCLPYVANQYPEALNYFLIRQPLVAVGQEDDAAILEAVFQDVVLHDAVVAVCVDADVPVV